MMNTNQYKERFLLAVSDHLSQREAAVAWRAVYEDVFRATDYSRFDEIVEKLIQGLPLQYITGVAHFYGMVFHVSPDVLIPRPETEELVYWVLSSFGKEPMRCIDIGTGSGCIPLTIKRHRPDWQVSAMDISSKALHVAKENAKRLDLDVYFIEGDMTDRASYPEGQQVIICNPPYVLDSDRAFMSNQVLDYEPDLALFVPDSDPFKYYRSVLENAAALYDHVDVFFEIHQKYADAMMDLVSAFTDVTPEMRKDLQGNDRMVRCQIKKS